MNKWALFGIIGVLIVFSVGLIIILNLPKNSLNIPSNLEFDKYVFPSSNYSSNGGNLNVRPPFTPLCEVTGIITDVHFVPEYTHPCSIELNDWVENDSICEKNLSACCPEDIRAHDYSPARYTLRVYVLNLKEIKEVTNQNVIITDYDESCNDSIQVRDFEFFSIDAYSDRPAPQSHQIIRGIVIPYFGFNSNYTLYDSF